MSQRHRAREEALAAVRFGLAGGLNTLVTGVLLSLLATAIDPALAYTLVFAVGIALSTYLAGAFVFRVRMSRKEVALYVALYVGVYLVGLACLGVAIRLGMPEAWSGLVVFVTAPLTFLGGRWLLKGGRNARTAGPDVAASVDKNGERA